MMNVVPFETVARLPTVQDNIAIATRLLPSGTQIRYNDDVITLSHTVLLGHRFAVMPVRVGDALLSWGQTFGIAISPIKAGDYVCNADVLKELRRRSIEIDLPDAPNFQNELEHFRLDEANFQPADALPRHSDQRTFMGYAREGGRGVGTRNTVVLLGTSSLTAGFVRKLEAQLKSRCDAYENVDDIVAIAHTEGAHQTLNNRDLLLRTLTGFAVHANVGAVLIVDYPQASVTNADLEAYFTAHDYPLQHVIHGFFSLSDSFEGDLQRAENQVIDWLDTVNATARTPQPLSALKIALQCGGSDAFSGISGNPLASWVAKEVIQYGGGANLAETDELIGAETYVLDKVRDLATAQKFLSFVARFKERVGWHGHSADGNPSGGNKFRGLYNIYLKSLGAATKRHPDVPLDYVIDYSEPMQESGFYFMDSPGNDLESIAGQVASGCNMIFFVTGNGSITNFPFVPTIKIVTTTERYELLSDDMDINAGAYLDGTPLDDLGRETLNYTVDVASGQLSVGEKAGHSQVQIWRNWQQTQPIEREPLEHHPLAGEPLSIQLDIAVPDVQISMLKQDGTISSDAVGLILPTSLCSGQIARMCVDTLNKHPLLQDTELSRFVTLVHTEGCGGSVNEEFRDTLLGYLAHPFVKQAILLEHGCEATHNDYFRHALRARGLDPDDYGWASIQLEGGIHNVIEHMVSWFTDKLRDSEPAESITTDLSAVKIALMTNAPLSAPMIDAYTDLTQMIVACGGTVVLHEHDQLLTTAYTEQLGIERIKPTLAYAQSFNVAGLHIMAMPTHDWSEILTGLGSSGVEVMVNYTGEQPMPGHPMIPVLQISDLSTSVDLYAQETDGDLLERLLTLIVSTLSRQYVPISTRTGNINFQITRGLLGVSL